MFNKHLHSPHSFKFRCIFLFCVLLLLLFLNLYVFICYFFNLYLFSNIQWCDLFSAVKIKFCNCGQSFFFFFIFILTHV